MADAPVDICNWALLRLGQSRIASIDPPFTDGDDGVEATCSFLYPLVRDAELRVHPWSFARERMSLAADATAPAFGYANRFLLPAGFLRMVPDKHEDWQVEGAYILSNCGAPLDLPYIKRVTDVTRFDPLFVAALSCQLAVSLCEKVTASNTKKQLALKDYDDAIAQAKRTNAIERPSQKPPESSLISVRR